nr:hypothetical protein [uncultured Flavobacterium sp.]
MKLEIAESVVSSWLKHYYGCQIVQQNWKISSSWEKIIDPKETEKILQKLKTKFKDLDLEFTTDKMSSSQMILQGEIDCLGINFKLDLNNNLIVDKIYAVDVAFHENGLNYGGSEKTSKKIRQKLIRTAITIHQYFGLKEGEIIFASPKTAEKHFDNVKKNALHLKEIFNSLGFNYDFKIYCNKDFEEFIYNRLINHVNDISDTSELFIRSLKLINMFNEKPDRKKLTKELNERSVQTELKEVTNLKIGVTAKNIFKEFSDNQSLSNNEIEKLENREYSKEVLGLYFPALIQYKKDNSSAYINGINRYYTKPLTFNEKKYLLSNYWIENQREALEQWYKRIKNVAI